MLGENKKTEFKSTLRYDIKKEAVEKFIEHAVMKTKAACILFVGATLAFAMSFSARLGSAQEIKAPATIQTFPVGTLPDGMAFDGANICVASGNNSRIIKLRASDGAQLRTSRTGGGSLACSVSRAASRIAPRGSGLVVRSSLASDSVMVPQRRCFCSVARSVPGCTTPIPICKTCKTATRNTPWTSAAFMPRSSISGCSAQAKRCWAGNSNICRCCSPVEMRTTNHTPCRSNPESG